MLFLRVFGVCIYVGGIILMIILRNKMLERLLVTLLPYRVLFRDWLQASSEPCPSWKATVTGPRHRHRGFVKVVCDIIDSLRSSQGRQRHRRIVMVVARS